MKTIIDYFQTRKFQWVKGAPLIVPTSTTVPFCISGGVPYEAIIAGDNPVTITQFANMQTCIRTAKLEAIGYTGKHHICFNMLGHFMFGVANSKDTKFQMIETAYLFLLSLGLKKNYIAATADEEDVESQEIWNTFGVKLFVLSGKKVREAKNKRSGYQTEIMYRVGEDSELGAYRELWNIVIYQFAKPNFTEPLMLAYADSGASWDRVISAKEGVKSNYENSMWRSYLSALSFDSACAIFNRIAEFLKAVTYLATESEFYPSNKGAAYEFRKLIRKMFILCSMQELNWEDLLKKTSTHFNIDSSYATVAIEIEKFKAVLVKGYVLCQKNKQVYTEDLATQMYEQNGFPKELFTEIKQKGGIEWIEKLKK